MHAHAHTMRPAGLHMHRRGLQIEVGKGKQMGPGTINQPISS